MLRFLRVEDLVRFELVGLDSTPEAAAVFVRVFRERTEHFLDVLGRMSRLHLGVMICPSGRSAYDTKVLGSAVKVAEHTIAAELRGQQRHVVMGLDGI